MNRFLVNVIALIGSLLLMFYGVIVWFEMKYADTVSGMMFTAGVLGAMCAMIEIEKDIERYKRKKRREKHGKKNRVLV